MVGTSTDRLYEIDPATGAAAVVGSAVMFDAPGGGENSPSGLASRGAVLYMTGDGQNRLYALNTATGTAAPVGTLTGFGVSENSPQGIAGSYTRPSGYEIDSSTGAITYTGGPAAAGVYKLYAQASDHQAIDGGGTSDAVDTEIAVTVDVANLAPSFGERGYSYTLTSGSDGSVTPVAVGTPSAVDPENQPITYSLRVSDSVGRVYVLGGGGDVLYALDSVTGVAVRVGAVEGFGVSETAPRGIGWHNGQLYMTGGGGLYTVDVVTGEAVRVAGESQLIGDDVSAVSLSGVASHDGELYVTAAGSVGRLYRVDLDALTAIRIGGDDFGGVGETSPAGIASHGTPAGLYMLGSDSDALYTVDASDGSAVRVGSADGFGVDEGLPVGLVSHNGGLYMTGNSNNALYALDAVTGEATRVGDVDEFGVGEFAVKGIATGYHAPEGFTVNSATGEIAYIGVWAAPGVHISYVQASDSRNPANIADTAVDDTARVTVTVHNRPPVFAKDSYRFDMLPSVDGTGTAQPVGTVAAPDPEGDTISYSLRVLSASDSSEPVYMVGSSNDALYTLAPATGAIHPHRLSRRIRRGHHPSARPDMARRRTLPGGRPRFRAGRHLQARPLAPGWPHG